VKQLGQAAKAPVSMKRGWLNGDSGVAKELQLSPAQIWHIGSLKVFATQSCFPNVSWASRLKASMATVLSRRGAVMSQVQSEQHQPRYAATQPQAAP
jgi:hypothetical protein